MEEDEQQTDGEVNVQEERAAYGREKPKARDTARLIWASKPKKEPNAKELEFQTAEEVYPNLADVKDKKLLSCVTEKREISTQPNRLIWGDNLLVMQALLAQGYEGQIDLIYIDPPFNTGENFNFPNSVSIGETKLETELPIAERLAYSDTWARGVDSFLDMLYPRIQLMRRLLSDKGILFVHCDVNASHYIKIMLDELFGRENFVNEIVWKRTNNPKGSQYESKKFGVSTDSIFIYSKSFKYTFNVNVIRTPLTEDEIGEKYPNKDEKGRYYPGPVIRSKSMGERPNLVYEYKKYKPGPWGWRLKKEELIKLDGNGDLGWSSTGSPFRKLRPENDLGKPMFNLWDDINRLYSGNEFLDYPTQKPKALLKRIIEAASNEGDLIADFFCGSGTTAFVSESLKRRWITSDLSKTAIQVTRGRLVNQNANPFLIQNLGNYQRQLIYAKEVNLRQMYNIILKLYGAIPKEDWQGFGVSREENQSLIFVCEPDRPMTGKKAFELATLAKTADGKGYKKLIILAWDYDYNFDDAFYRLSKNSKKKLSEVEFKIIPSDVYRYLRSTKVGDQELTNKIAFYQKPYFRLSEPQIIAKNGNDIQVSIKIEQYVVMDIPVKDETKRPEIEKLLHKNFANLIDYWAVDWEYDEEVFKSRWQAIRDKNSDEPVSMVAYFTLKTGKKYTIAVRVVDVFGNDVSMTKEIDLR